MMKRILSIILVLIMVINLSSCSIFKRCGKEKNNYPENLSEALQISLDFDKTNEVFHVSLENKTNKAYSFWVEASTEVFHINIVHKGELLPVSYDAILKKLDIKGKETLEWRVPWDYKNISQKDCQAFASINAFTIDNNTKIEKIGTIKSSVIDLL